MDVPFVRHSDEVEDVLRLSDWSQKRINPRALDLASCCLRKPFDNYFLMEDAEEYEKELDLMVRLRFKNTQNLFGWHNHNFLALPPAKHFLFYAPVFVF